MEVKAKGKYHSEQLYIGRRTSRLFSMLIGQKEMEAVGLNGLHFECYAKRSGSVPKFDLVKIFSLDPPPVEPKKSHPIVSLQWSMKVRAFITHADTDGVLFDSSGESQGVIKDVWGVTETRQKLCSLSLGHYDSVMTHYDWDYDGTDQTLTLEAEVEIIAKIHDDRQSLRMINAPRPMRLDVLELLRKGCSDISVKCGSEDITAHKIMLTTYSPVFARMLESPMDESVTNVINIDDFEPETIQSMIAFMYKGTLMATSKSSIVALLDCAEKYDIAELKVAVIKKMLSIIAPENAAEFSAAVTKFRGDEESKQQIFDYCKANFSELSTNSHFRQFFKENVQYFL